MRRNFTDWLKEQAYRNDLVGELAEEALRQSDWPKTNTRLAFEVYLHRNHATSLGIKAFQIAYQEWENSKHLPPINMWMKPTKALS